jgi:pimeloyl-ACP methyl ester carboxylesterase
MKILGTILNWFLVGIICLIAVSKYANGNWLQAILLTITVLLLIPQVRREINKQVKFTIPWYIHSGIIICLLVVVYLIIQINKPKSIYVSDKYKNQFMSFYDKQMKDWPTPYETKYIETKYGKAHVIIGGPKDAPPVILCHAGALPSWSWKYNIKELNKYFRTYAIDAMGEVGKTILYDVNKHTKDGKDIAELYNEIFNKLKIKQANLIGASYGGYIGTNIAIHHPELINKLVLIGPMGVTPATASTLFRITLLTIFPIKPMQNSFIDWMVAGDKEKTKEIIDWMRLVFIGARAKEAPPMTFSLEELEKVNAPVLLILGDKDNLVGDPQKVIEYTQAIDEIQTNIVKASHGIWAEQSEDVNTLAINFLK